MSLTPSLLDSKIPADLKCADIIVSNGNVVFVDGPGAGKIGSTTKASSAVCIDSTCRACDPTRPSPDVWTIYCKTGLGAPRTCVSPGVFTDVNNVNWKETEYHQDPTRVWLAIYFPFSIIGLVTLCLILFKKRVEHTPVIGRAFNYGSMRNVVPSTFGYTSFDAVGKEKSEDRLV